VGYRYTNLLIKGYAWLACYPNPTVIYLPCGDFFIFCISSIIDGADVAQRFLGSINAVSCRWWRK